MLETVTPRCELRSNQVFYSESRHSGPLGEWLGDVLLSSPIAELCALLDFGIIWGEGAKVII